MKLCKKCGLLLKDCSCNKRTEAPKSINCRTCNVIHQTAYLILGQCHDCHDISQLEPDEREHYRVLADRFGFRLFDIKLHVRAANVKNIQIETYLASLPRNLAQYKEYWRGKNPSLGGVPLL